MIQSKCSESQNDSHNNWRSISLNVSPKRISQITFQPTYILFLPQKRWWSVAKVLRISFEKRNQPKKSFLNFEVELNLIKKKSRLLRKLDLKILISLASQPVIHRTILSIVIKAHHNWEWSKNKTWYSRGWPKYHDLNNCIYLNRIILTNKTHLSTYNKNLLGRNSNRG